MRSGGSAQLSYLERVVEVVEGGGQPLLEDLLPLLRAAHQLFLREPQLLLLKAPQVVVCGDTHGDVETTLRLLKRYPPEKHTVVMLGDYVDRGEHSLENASLLLALKLLHPRRLVLLRGNHESMLINQAYGFYMELSRKQRPRAFELFVRFNEVFSTLPYAAFLKPLRILMIHGGVPTTMPSLKQIERLPKKDLIPSDETAFQLLWNDPSEGVEEFAPSERGAGVYLYGRRAVERFLAKNRLQGIIRSHEAVEEGYSFSFSTEGSKRRFTRRLRGFRGLVLTIFSSRAYGIPPRAAVIDGNNLNIESI